MEERDDVGLPRPADRAMTALRLRPWRAVAAMSVFATLAWWVTRLETDDEWVGHATVLAWRLLWCVALGASVLVAARTPIGRVAQGAAAAFLAACAAAPAGVGVYLWILLALLFPGGIILALVWLVLTVVLFSATRQETRAARRLAPEADRHGDSGAA